MKYADRVDEWKHHEWNPHKLWIPFFTNVLRVYTFSPFIVGLKTMLLIVSLMSVFFKMCVCCIIMHLGPLYSKINTISKKDVKYSLVYTDIIAEETRVFIYHSP